MECGYCECKRVIQKYGNVTITSRIEVRSEQIDEITIDGVRTDERRYPVEINYCPFCAKKLEGSK